MHTHCPLTQRQEYARKKHAGSEWFERSLRSELSSQESRRKRKAGYRKEAADAALARVEKYGECVLIDALRMTWR